MYLYYLRLFRIFATKNITVQFDTIVALRGGLNFFNIKQIQEYPMVFFSRISYLIYCNKRAEHKPCGATKVSNSVRRELYWQIWRALIVRKSGIVRRGVGRSGASPKRRIKIRRAQKKDAVSDVFLRFLIYLKSAGYDSNIWAMAFAIR